MSHLFARILPPLCPNPRHSTMQPKLSLTRALLSYAFALGSALISAPQPALADTISRTSSFEYNDDKGQLTREAVEPDRPNDCLVTTYAYDTFGNRTSTSLAACTGASGWAVSSASAARTGRVGFGSDGRFARTSSNALNHTEVKDYEPGFGNVVKLTGPNRLITTWAFDSFGRKIKELRADGTYTTWRYLLCTDAGSACPDAVGGAAITWVAIEQSFGPDNAANAPEKRQFHDTLDRVARVQTQGYDGNGAAPGLVQDTHHNNLGQVLRKSDVYALATGTPVWTTYQYDAMGRVTREETPDPDAPSGVAVTTMAYSGLVTTVVNAKGQTKTTTKNGQGHVVLVADDLNGTVAYAYDALGNLLATNAGGSVTLMGYNQRGQKTSMLDPAMGAWSYAYNAFGELVWQRDSLSQATTMAYDALGRLTQRTEPDLASTWRYDTRSDGLACGKSVGKLCEARTDNGYLRTHTYDALGRPSTTATVLDNAAQPATVSVAYDRRTGQLARKTWPTQYQASYAYSPLGYLKQVTGGGTNSFTQTVGYEVLAQDAQGHITQYRYGNQVTTVKAYNATTHRLSGQTASFAGLPAGNVLNQQYSHDTLGNLTERLDLSPGANTRETFAYDRLNRLSLATLEGGALSTRQQVQVLYDARGNIRYKSDAGLYWYDLARPNRLAAVLLEADPAATVPLTGTRALSYLYDDARPQAAYVDAALRTGNGNLESTVSHDEVNTRHTQRTEQYTSFNMPAAIRQGEALPDGGSTTDRTLAFTYGPEHQRIRQTVALSGNGTAPYTAGTTWYLNGEDSLGLSYEKEVRTNGTTEHKHYVSAGGVVFALHTSRTGNLNGLPAQGARYFHQDHLGSVVAITDTTGAVVERLAFDVWGKRRQPNGQADVTDAIVPASTERGYTMHEHLDEVGVVHMNGRLYDPLVGRFMSADPFIQNPGDLQSYDRYAYVLNNPLSLTDPSGYFSLKKLIRTAVAMYVGYLTAGAAQSWLINVAGETSTAFVAAGTANTCIAPTLTGLGHAVAGAVGGFSAGAIGSGTTNGALQGALSGGLMGAAGSVGASTSMERYAAHAAAGCISAAAGGGKCGSGAISAVFGKWSTNKFNFANDVARGAATVVAGGVGSVLAGGKFEDGARTAAYGYLFNHCLEFGCTPSESGNMRGRDGYGRGDFGVSRDDGARRHEGMDFTTAPGEEIQAPIGGVVTRFFYPYAGDRRLTGVEIVNDAGESAKIMYVNPLAVIGNTVDAGKVIGYAQDLHVRYNQTMTNHVHVEIRVNGRTVNPYEFMRDGLR